jgi:hypothetical protein
MDESLASKTQSLTPKSIQKLEKLKSELESLNLAINMLVTPWINV